MKTFSKNKILLILLFAAISISLKVLAIQTFGLTFEDYYNYFAQDGKDEGQLVLGEETSQTLLIHPAAPVLAAPPSLFSVDGEVIGVTAENADDVVVFIRIVDMDGVGSAGSSTWVSTILQTVNGRYLWEADLGGVRASDFSDYFVFDSSDRYEVEVFGPGGFSTQYIGDVADIEAHDPLSSEPIVPAITILPVTADNGGGKEQVNILSPAAGQTFSESRPTFSGSGPANTLLDISIVGTNIRANVDTDQNGNWSWTPGSDIPPGEHVLRIEYTGAGGEVLSEELNFSIISPPETGHFKPLYFITIFTGFILTILGTYSFLHKSKYDGKKFW